MTEFGLGMQSDKEVGEYAQLAALAESFDFDVLSVYGDLMFQPPIVALLEMARATSRVRLGAACWNPYTLHPYEIAGQVAALDNASDGRAYLGLTQGSWLDSIGVHRPRPVQTLDEAITVITMLLAGDDGGFAGEVFTLAPGTRFRYPVRRRRVPLLVGAWGPRLAALAGRLADELKIGGTASPDLIALIRQRVAVGAAGRTPPGIVVGAVTVVAEDAALARAKARQEVALYLDVVAKLDPTVDVPPDLPAEELPDELLDRFAFSGSPEQVAAQAQQLIDAGAARIEFGTPHGLTSARGIELLGSRVLPLLNR